MLRYVSSLQLQYVSGEEASLTGHVGERPRSLYENDMPPGTSVDRLSRSITTAGGRIFPVPLLYEAGRGFIPLMERYHRKRGCVSVEVSLRLSIFPFGYFVFDRKNMDR